MRATQPVGLREVYDRAYVFFRGPWKKHLPQLLDMLVALGRAQVSEGRYSQV
jgi:hypothetical protein